MRSAPLSNRRQFQSREFETTTARVVRSRAALHAVRQSVEVSMNVNVAKMLQSPGKVLIHEGYVCVPEGTAVGPVTTDLLVRGILADRVPRNAFVARPGDDLWQEILDVPEIVRGLTASSG
jgi:hypothetical protein